jgi:biopolymer transport protein ExbB
MTTRHALSAGLVAVSLGGCSFDLTGLPAGGDPIDGAGPVDGASTGRFQKPITVPAGAVDAPLADFPLYVELTDDDLAGGANLHFVAADGTSALDHELQAWDPSTGHLEAWVRVPAIAANASTTIYLRYGAFDAPPADDPAGVWQNGFVAVWHLEDEPQGTSGDIRDATGVTHATSDSMGPANQVDGVLGGGLAITDDLEQLTFQNPLLGASQHTISAWVNQRAVTHHSALVVLGNGACNQARWFHTRFTAGTAAAGFYCDDWADTGVDLQGDGWTLLHWTYADPTSVVYRDGVAAADPWDHAGNQSTVGATGFIGNAPPPFGGDMHLDGSVDEVRISDVARAPAWIAAEAANQAAPADFYTVGPTEQVP